MGRRMLLVRVMAADGEYTVCAGKNRNNRYDHRGTFADDKTCYSEADGRRHIVLSAEIVDQVDRPDAEDLF